MSNYKPEAYKFSNPTHISVKKTLICNHDDPVEWTDPDPDYDYLNYSRQILFNPRTNSAFEQLYSSNTDVDDGKYKDSGDIIFFYVRRFALRITNVVYTSVSNTTNTSQSPYIGFDLPGGLNFIVKKGFDHRYDTALITSEIPFDSDQTFHENWFLWDNSMQQLIQDNTSAGGLNSLATFSYSTNFLKATNSAHRAWTDHPLYFDYCLVSGPEAPLSMTVDIWIEMLITKIWNSGIEVPKYNYINRDEAL